MDFEHIHIEKDMIPYRFQIALGADIFEMHIQHNEMHDYFTVDLYKDGEVLVYGEKLVYGVPLYSEVYDDRFPAPEIIPLDDSGNETRITSKNLNETVFLQVMNR